jgi:hypothetical protein
MNTPDFSDGLDAPGSRVSSVVPTSSVDLPVSSVPSPVPQASISLPEIAEAVGLNPIPEEVHDPVFAEVTEQLGRVVLDLGHIVRRGITEPGATLSQVRRHQPVLEAYLQATRQLERNLQVHDRIQTSRDKRQAALTRPAGRRERTARPE